MVLIKVLIFSFIFLTSVNATELSQEELNYFDITDLNSDGFVTINEINQSLILIFQLVDLNRDDKISLKELEELKEIYKILMIK